jgi:hypothetical protein
VTRPRPAPRTSCLPGPRSLSQALPRSRRIGTRVALAWTICLAPACGDAPEDTASAPAPTAEPQTAEPLAASASAEQHAGAAADQRAAHARARVDALLAEPTPQHLLAVLAQSHADARALLGPHRLRYKASFKLTPQTPARPVVDEPVQLEQQVVDELVLAWGSAVGQPVRMHLSQQTDKGEGREVIILDETVHTRLAYRGWQVRPLDSELHTIWLDEAQHCVHDLVELAAPALAVSLEATDDAVEVTLTRADSVDPARIAAGHGREWRQRAEIQAVTGSIRLARATGLWLSAELTVGYVLRDVQERPQRGEAQLTASVEPAADVVVEAPTGATPVPERHRPELERQRLLGGLAGT